MSLFRKVTEQGGTLVVRDEDNKVVSKARPLGPAAKQVESWRSQMRRINNGGMDTLLRIANIANGNPVRSYNPDDGTHTDWMVPTISEQLNAAQFLAEFQLGKAVAQTEVMKAEEQANDQAQYAAMSDDALREAAMPFLERANKKIAELASEIPITEKKEDDE